MGPATVQTTYAPAPKPDETTLIDVVERALHSSASEWLFLRELRVGTGRQNGGSQRLDAFALNTLPHTAMKRVCYEVKVSRSDFLAELRHPLKRRIGMRYSNEFYFVTPAALVNAAEIPSECGLVEAGFASIPDWKQLFRRHAGFFHYDPDTHAYCMITIPAPWRDTPGPTWQLVAAMMRNQRRELSDDPPPRPAQQRLALSQVCTRESRSPAPRWSAYSMLLIQGVQVLANFDVRHRGNTTFRAPDGWHRLFGRPICHRI